MVVLVLGLVLAAIEAFETLILPVVLGLPMPPPDIGGISSYLVSGSLIVLTLALTMIVAFNRRAKYSYDEHGIYRKGKLLFDWYHVNKVTSLFKGSSRGINVPVGPSLMAVLTGGPTQQVNYESYGATLSFVLTDGNTVSIPTNLDRMSRESLVEDVHRVSKAANPSIQFN